MSSSEDEVRAVAEEIAKFRREFWDNLRSDIDNELDEIVSSGYDPAQGTGRGAKWAEGA
jgi:hypothetical protein